MKTYLSSPVALPRFYQGTLNLARQLENIFSQKLAPGQLAEKLFKALAAVFPLDQLMLYNPSGDTGTTGMRTYHLFPSLNHKRELPVYFTAEQDSVMLHTGQTIIRVANQDDHAITVRALRDEMPKTPFSAIFIRAVVQTKYVAVLCLAAKKKEAYTDMHVASLFLVESAIRGYWNSLASDLQKSGAAISAIKDHLPFAELEGMQETVSKIWKISRLDVPVLLLGETGTGKEVAANMLYQGSARNAGPFIKMNCVNIPDTLVDSELFGHERGAFTGAVDTYKGRFERADRGTLLLDELGDLPLTAQARLLRVLQEGVIERVGGGTEIPVDVRIMAATHRDLPAMVKSGSFRQDLLYRLNIFPIFIPALRERPQDIPGLINFFIRNKCERYGIYDLPRISPGTMKKLCSYNWPGNIRELQNVVERSVILWAGAPAKVFRMTLDSDAVFQQISSLNESAKAAPAPADAESKKLDDVIKRHLRAVLGQTGGKVNGRGGAAEILGLNPSSLRSKMRKLGLTSKSRP